MIVVDANVIVAAIIKGPCFEMAEFARRKDIWAAPTLWKSEVRSALTKLIRAKVIALTDAQLYLGRAEHMMLCRDYSVRGEKVLEYASKTNGSAYDCEYIVLAEDWGVPLVTTDEALIKHFPKIAIHLRDYAAI